MKLSPFFSLSFSFVFVSFFLLRPDGQAGSGVPVLAEDFERPNQSEIYQRLTNHRLLEIADGEGVGGGRALKATYEGFERGSRRMVVQVPLEKAAEEMTLCYDVKFDEGFDFVRGGKLHGLAPERSVSGGQPMVAEGWSARVNFGRGGTVRTYLYVQNKTNRYGISRGNPDFRFEDGRYHAVSYFVKLNSDPGEADGVVRIYIDGELMVEHSDLQFRAVDGPETLISRLHFSTFHGGSNPEWAPKDKNGEYATHHAYFDNFAIYEGEQIRRTPGME